MLEEALSRSYYSLLITAAAYCDYKKDRCAEKLFFLAHLAKLVEHAVSKEFDFACLYDLGE